MMITLAVIGFIGCYTMFIIFLSVGWNRQIRKSKLLADVEGEDKVKISIIVPCRNEESTIGRLLERLVFKLPDAYSLEIWCVDDHSTDNTAKVIKQFERVKYVSIADVMQGKKAAIEEGIRKATGDVIIITDADCVPDEDWLKNMIYPFLSSEIHMVCGWVRMKGDGTFFSELVSLEFSTMVALSAAMNGLKRPVLCNGASLAFRKQSFVDVGGYSSDKSASGDDVFLMHKFKAMYGEGAIHYMIQPNAGVETTAPNTWKEFVHQRIRWARKSIWYRDKDTIMLLLFILSLHGWLLLWFVAAWVEPEYWKVVGFSWLGKSALDVFWVRRYSRTLKQKNWGRFVLPLCLVHWLYIPVMAVFSQLTPTIEWKGRTWKNG